jgi:hypothetical protein
VVQSFLPLFSYSVHDNNRQHQPVKMSNDKPKGIVVFSGGSAANNLVDVFNAVRESKKCQLSYVIPISDNGGSSSELIRVFGGPGMETPLFVTTEH